MLASFNSEQLSCVKSQLGPVMVVAGAGTGKTRVLTNRILYLISEYKMKPEDILAITFTNKAAKEMLNRVNEKLEGATNLNICTFHSLCLKILRQDIKHLGVSNNFTIVDEEDKMHILKEITSEEDIKALLNDNSIGDKRINNSNLIKFITKAKTSNINIEEITQIKEINNFGVWNFNIWKYYKTIYQAYCHKLVDNNLLDFDDLILYVLRLFENKKEVAQKWKNTFKYILVDEFQDTDRNQLHIINYLVNDDKNIFVVGDEDQTIYTWRGAYPRIFDDFLSKYTNTKTYVLSQNYRSHKKILDIANNLIKFNKKTVEKKLVTENCNGEDVELYEGGYEGKYIANKILQLMKNKDVAYRDITILCRSNSQTRDIEKNLIDFNIPYYIFGSVKFYQRKEIKDLISYLTVLVNFDNEIAIKRIINVPSRSIGQVTVKKISEYAKNKHITFSSALIKTLDLTSDITWDASVSIINFLKLLESLRSFSKNHLLSETLNKIIEDTNYLTYLKEFDEETFEDRYDNIKELVESILKLENEKKDTTVADYLSSIQLYSEGNTEIKDRNNVNIMTIHIAKGMEYPYVFICGLNDGVIPITRHNSQVKDVEEERRILYVGITRAKKQLFLSRQEGYSFLTKTENTPSRFITEIGRENFKIVKDELKKLNDSDLEYFNSKKQIDYSKQYSDEVQQYSIGDTIVHTFFGQGTVVDVINGGKYIEVLFKHPHGLKTLVSNHISIKRMVK